MPQYVKGQKYITNLFQQWSNEIPLKTEVIPPSGSDRRYYRIYYSKGTVMGVFNPIAEENLAFTGFTQHFARLGLPVPQLLAHDLQNQVYLLEDLGDTTLFSLLPHQYEPCLFDEKIMEFYRKTLDVLPLFQVKAAQGLDFSLCYPRDAFDRNSMMWDLNYFKYYFLKLAGIQYDEQKLEEDFKTLCDFLLQADDNYFLYRDFQSRNIMISNDEPHFIDYQGGRKGALQYDIASLLYDAKANIHPEQREELLDYYIQSLGKHIEVDEESFRGHFYGFVFIRIMQAMGAYGFRGFYEKKTLFLQSIPYARRNIRWLLENKKLPAQVPYLHAIMEQIVHSPHLKRFDKTGDTFSGLTVSIRSFSYRKGYPADHSGNGGGFVFDCRCLPNPGRQDAYKSLTGKDEPVIIFLEQEPAVQNFVNSTAMLVENAVEEYMRRGFSHLMVGYGCTGGQHRSVYSAQKLAARLKEKFDVAVDLQHLEEGSWPEKKN